MIYELYINVEFDLRDVSFHVFFVRIKDKTSESVNC